MENNNNNNDFDLDKELMPIYIKNIKLAYYRKKEMAEALERAKLDRQRKEGMIIGGAAALAAIIGISVGATMIPKIKTDTPTIAEVTEMTEETKTLISRYYVVKSGENLYSISEKIGVSIDDLKRENGMETKDTTIFPEQRLRISYYVNSSDLDSYTETIIVNGKTLKEIADEYTTSEETLYRLNPDSIVMSHNENYTSITYTIKSDTIRVPNYIALREMDQSKGRQK